MYVLDEKGQLVVKALENPNYDWRTIRGISKETGLDEGEVTQIMSVLSDRVVRSTLPDREGRALFTTRDHYYGKRNLAERVLLTFTDRIR